MSSTVNNYFSKLNLFSEKVSTFKKKLEKIFNKYEWNNFQ